MPPQFPPAEANQKSYKKDLFEDLSRGKYLVPGSERPGSRNNNAGQGRDPRPTYAGRRLLQMPTRLADGFGLKELAYSSDPS